METALELFAHNGYHTTSIRKIASHANISYGLMYNYFDSKEHLVRAIIHQGIDRMLNVFDIDKDGVLSDEELAYFITENFKLIRQNVPFWKLYYSILFQPAVSQMVNEEYNEHMPEMRMILVNYFRQKEMPNPAMQAMLFTAFLEGITVNFIIDPVNFPLDQMRDMVLEKIPYKLK
jgi:AcrR family transcriptional regulator